MRHYENVWKGFVIIKEFRNIGTEENKRYCGVYVGYYYGKEIGFDTLERNVNTKFLKLQEEKRGLSLI